MVPDIRCDTSLRMGQCWCARKGTLLAHHQPKAAHHILLGFRLMLYGVTDHMLHARR